MPQENREVERQNRSLVNRIQIAQAERKDWKKELNVCLASYRSLPHPTTGVSPAELLFWRKIRTRLPELRDVHVELEGQDRDNEQKNKGKMYADNKRKACYSDILLGDKILVQEERQYKFSMRFNPVPFLVVRKQGNSLVVESQEGVKYSRNTSHCKKFQEPFGDIEEIPQIEIDPDLPITPRKADIERTVLVLEDHVQPDGGVPHEGESGLIEQDTSSKRKRNQSF